MMARGKKNETATEIASGRNTNFRERSATPAANMLRIIRGAGKPYELLVQMKKAIDSAIKFQELYSYWPFDVITNDLLVEDEMETFLARGREGTSDQATIDRWWKDGTFDRMMAEHTIHASAFDLPAEGDAVPDDRTRCQDHGNQSIRRTFHT